MTRTLASHLVLALTGLALAGDSADDQRLLDQAAARRTAAGPKPHAQAPRSDATPAAAVAGAQEAPSRAAQDDESRARAAADLAQARLELVLARKALRTGEHALATQHADNALRLVRALPDSDEISDIQLKAEGVRAVAARSTGTGAEAKSAAGAQNDVGARLPSRSHAPPGGRSQITLSFGADATTGGGTDMVVDAQVSPGGAAPVTQSGTGWPVGWPNPSDWSYQPERRLIDPDDTLARELAQYRYQGIEDGVDRDDAVVRLTQAHEALQGGTGLVEYPDDWPETVRKRAPYVDGVIARTPSWRDKDGREWYMAIYDIHDLIYTPPDFGGNGEPAGSFEDLQFTLDRAALREYSWIFRGYYADFQDAWPLLRSYGGYDSFARMVGYSQANAFGPFFGDSNGGKYSLEKQAEVVSMIRQFTGMRDDGSYAQPVLQPGPQDAPNEPRIGPQPQVPQPLRPADAPR